MLLITATVDVLLEVTEMGPVLNPEMSERDSLIMPQQQTVVNGGHFIFYLLMLL